MSTYLSVGAILISISYQIIKHKGYLDKLPGRNKAVEGLKRLRNTTGYPISWIEDEKDPEIFDRLYKIMKKNTKQEKIKKVLDEGFKPYLITTGGYPKRITGVPDNWEPEEKYFYSDEYPILMCFKNSDNNTKYNKGDKVCTIGELKNWISKENDKIDLVIGTIFIGGILKLIITFLNL